jgi:plastocyanin
VRRLLPLTVLLLAVLVSAGCGSDDNGETTGDTGAAGGESVALTATEFKFDPADVTVDTAGKVTFTVTNDGQETHALEVEGNGVEEETDSIAAGESGTLTVDLEPGEYEFYCPIDGHREQGMEGKLVVGGSSSGAGSTTGGTDTGDSGYYGG